MPSRVSALLALGSGRGRSDSANCQPDQSRSRAVIDAVESRRRASVR
jgi:hypothetical protein